MPVTLDEGAVAESPEAITRRFAELYERTYGHSFDVRVDILSVRSIERTSLPGATRAAHSNVNGAGSPSRTARAYSFANEDWCEFELIDRTSLPIGSEFGGPAIVMETTTTSYIDADLTGVVHESGALILTGTLALTDLQVSRQRPGIGCVVIMFGGLWPPSTGKFDPGHP